MKWDELVDKIGTIAKSGTKEFIKIYEKIKELPAELIGVGFYSSWLPRKLL